LRVLVTGGAGFIGSHLVDALIDDGADVIVLDDLSSGYIANVHPKAELVVADVADAEVTAKVAEGCELVFHQAAHRAVFRSVEHPLDTDRANVTGTLSVLVAAQDAGVRRVVSASSSSVYGGATSGAVREDAPLQPRSPYAVTKLAGEHYCRVFHELHGLDTVSLRYFNAFGPRQRPDSQYAAVVPLFIAALCAGHPPEVHGDGLQTRAFTYVTDVVAANLRAAMSPAERCAGRAYNIAGDRAHSLLDLLAVLEELVGAHVPPVHTDARPGDVRHSLADISAAARDLDHGPSLTLVEGLERTVAWYRSEEETTDDP
jgi:UDP-glucose 4-epimerase